jgi:hypothetical protein
MVHLLQLIPRKIRVLLWQEIRSLAFKILSHIRHFILGQDYAGGHL